MIDDSWRPRYTWRPYSPNDTLAMLILLKIIAAALSALPLQVALSFGRSLGSLFAILTRFRKQECLETLQRAFPSSTNEEREEIYHSMYRNLGMTAVETLRILRIGLDDLEGRVTIHGTEHISELVEHEKAGLGLMSHIGNWELCGYFTRVLKRPATVVVKPIRNKGVNRYITDARKRMGLNLLPHRDSYKDCLRVLKSNGMVAIIADQNMRRSGGVFVDFFGKQACTTVGLALLSAQTKTPVYPVYSVRRENQYHDFYILAPISPPPDRDMKTLTEYTQRYTKILEDLIREHPDQWIWMHRRWRTRPGQTTNPQPKA